MPDKPAARDKKPSADYGVGRRLAFALYTIFLMVGGVGAWAVTSDLSGAVIAQGSVVVDEHSKRIQHRDGGIVAAINVKNGDQVKQDDVLIALDDTH
jgi:HlyD family secretion protein